MLCVLAVALLCAAVYNVEGSFNENCTDLNFQTKVDIDSLMGLWIGVEIITHTKKENWYDVPYKNDVTCPIINIFDATHEISTTEAAYRQGNNHGQWQRPPASGGGNQNWGQNKYIRVSWSENNKTLDYVLKYNPNARGSWLSIADFKDTSDYAYNQFTGKIQVIQALQNHLTLYFCERRLGSQQFSIILSRTHHQLSSEAIQAVYRHMNSRSIPMIDMKKVCNSVSDFRSGIIPILTVLLLFTWNLNSR